MSESGVTFHAHGMHCHGCEHIIETSVRKLPGIRSVKADYPAEKVTVAFDPAAVDLDKIRATIEQTGYRTYELDDPKRRRSLFTKLLGLILGVAGILLIIFFDTEWITKGGEPDIAQHMSLGLVFLVGLLTGFHCVGMCGGFVLSYTAADAREGRSSYLSHVLYGAGKTLSYTLIGAAFGLLGAFLTFTPMLRGVAGVLAGVFLVIFGLNMLGLFAPLRRLRLRLPGRLQSFLYEEQTASRHRPFVIGLLNGLMFACGPLQAMYVMAAGTGSAPEGAEILFTFAVGTLPVLLSFGVLTTLVSSSLTYRLLKVSGVIVVILGAVMINRGLILTGSGYDLPSIIASVSRTSHRISQCWSQCFLGSQSASPAAPGLGAPSASRTQVALAPRPRPPFQTIKMDVIESGYSPNHFVLIAGVPVKWVINGKQVTSCNHRIIVPSVKLEFDVKKGLQTIEFTPEKAGHIPWSCWMGMKHGDFDVVEEAPEEAPAPAPAEVAARAPRPEAPLAPPSRPAFQTIQMDVIESGYSPNHFVLIRGVPVKWVINGKQVTSCNHRIIVPSLKLEFDVKKGLQTIEFTPENVGRIPWSCWMGMKHGDFEVIEPPPAAPAQPEIATNAPTQAEIAANPPADSAEGIAPPNAVAASAPTGASSYTIVSGDTLRGVAVKLFHDARRWRDIAAVNPGLDARRLRPGQVIKLPEAPNERSPGR